MKNKLLRTSSLLIFRVLVICTILSNSSQGTLPGDDLGALEQERAKYVRHMVNGGAQNQHSWVTAGGQAFFGEVRGPTAREAGCPVCILDKRIAAAKADKATAAERAKLEMELMRAQLAALKKQ